MSYIQADILTRNTKTNIIEFSGVKTLYNLDDASIKPLLEAQLKNYNEKTKAEFILDSVVYSLFNTSSNQSSLRNITYQNKKWDIKNEWFYLSPEVVKLYAEYYKCSCVLDDLKLNGHDTFVYTYLKGKRLSKEALDVLRMAKRLSVLSLKYREEWHKDHPEHHLNCWDAGWYQIKILLKVVHPKELKEFTAFYKKLDEKIAGRVYDHGWLLR